MDNGSNGSGTKIRKRVQLEAVDVWCCCEEAGKLRSSKEEFRRRRPVSGDMIHLQLERAVGVLSACAKRPQAGRVIQEEAKQLQHANFPLCSSTSNTHTHTSSYSPTPSSSLSLLFDQTDFEVILPISQLLIELRDLRLRTYSLTPTSNRIS